MILVAYFSATGETARLAGTLARAAQADLYEIRPSIPILPPISIGMTSAAVLLQRCGMRPAARASQASCRI